MNARTNKNGYFLREENQNGGKEKKWDERFFLYKIPPYDAYKDVNYLSLGLIKSKIKYENILEKERTKKNKVKSPLYSEHYLIDSQQKKNNIGSRAFKESINDKNKKLIFSIENPNVKLKTSNSKKAYSLTYDGRIYNNKVNLGNKTGKKSITYKFKNDYDSSRYGDNIPIEGGDLFDEFEIIKDLWDKFGVTKKYQENFVNYINNLDRKDNIRQFLFLEKKQMQKFKYDLTQLLKKIIHRNDEINHLKNLIKLYTNIVSDKNFYIERKYEDLQNANEQNEKKVIEDINNCLLSLRVNTINVINQIKNFSITNSYYLYMNKIDLSKIKNDYYYNDYYLLSIKNDLDFVQHSALQNIYDFSSIEGSDPFFLSFTNIPEENQNLKAANKNEGEKSKKLKLPMNEKMLLEVQNCLFFLDQAEILNKGKSNNLNKNRILEFLNRNNSPNRRERINIDNVSGYGIGSSFKGNLEKNILKLKMQSGYDKLFTFIGNSPSPSVDRLKPIKQRNDIPIMTSKQLKEKFNEYELINNLIFENKTDRCDNYEINQNNEEILGKSQQEEKIQKKENIEKDTENEKDKQEEDNYENELENMKNEEEKKKEEKERMKGEEEEKNKLKEKNNKLNKSESIKSQIEEEKKEEEKPKYEINWYTNYLDELTQIYNDYLTIIPNSTKYDFYFPKTAKDFIKGMYPKVLTAKSNKTNSNKICGICGTYYYTSEDNDNDNDIILKIDHISAEDTNKEIITNFLDLIENNLDYKIIEYEFKTNLNNKNDLYEILIEKGFKEYNNNFGKKILRKENPNSKSQKEIGPQIKYDSLSILSLISKIDNDNQNTKKKYNCFAHIINQINLALLINVLKTNDKYKINILSSSSFESSLVKNISKLDNINFNFIKSKNNECLNINELTNNEISQEENNNYAMISNYLNIKIKSLMTLQIDNYLYNGIEINKNNIIKENKYMSNLFFISNLDKNIYIIIYQYNDSFEKYLYKNKTNIYSQFISLFKDNIQNFQMEEDNQNDDSNRKVLWVPAFSIDTNLFCSNIPLSKEIEIKNGENNDMNIEEFNDFLKINYLPDVNSDKNIKMNVNNDDDFIIKDKFLLGICHKKFMDYSNIPLISLINVTSDNFIKS